VRVALIGIDGAGKSTCARLLAQRSSAGRPHVILSCLRPHENPRGPLRELSRHLDTLSAEADRLGSPDLKLAILYLQMCTYGVVERFFAREPARAIVTERHPLVDTLTYLPLYRHAIDRVTGPRRRAALREQLAQMPAAAVEAALAWCETLARRPGGRTPRLDTLGAELVDLLTLPPTGLIAEFSARFEVTPPDVAILLDVDVAEAARRVRARGRHPEPHERADLLALVRDGYEQVLKTFASVRVYRVRADGRPAQDVAAEITQIAAL
jgi:thymidylate kinase